MAFSTMSRPALRFEGAGWGGEGIDIAGPGMGRSLRRRDGHSKTAIMGDCPLSSILFVLNRTWREWRALGAKAARRELAIAFVEDDVKG